MADSSEQTSYAIANAKNTFHQMLVGLEEGRKPYQAPHWLNYLLPSLIEYFSAVLSGNLYDGRNEFILEQVFSSRAKYVAAVQYANALVLREHGHEQTDLPAISAEATQFHPESWISPSRVPLLINMTGNATPLPTDITQGVVGTLTNRSELLNKLSVRNVHYYNLILIVVVLGRIYDWSEQQMHNVLFHDRAGLLYRLDYVREKSSIDPKEINDVVDGNTTGSVSEREQFWHFYQAMLTSKSRGKAVIKVTTALGLAGNLALNLEMRLMFMCEKMLASVEGKESFTMEAVKLKMVDGPAGPLHILDNGSETLRKTIIEIVQRAFG